MKKLLMVAALGAVLSSTTANSATVNDTFDVDITLTPVCSVNVTTNVAFAYTSGQAGAQASTGGDVQVTCTTGAPYTFSLIHNITGVAPVFPVSDQVTGLQYDLTVPGGTQNGTGGTQNFQITGNMNGLQPGTCGGGVCVNTTSNNKTYTLVVTY